MTSEVLTGPPPLFHTRKTETRNTNNISLHKHTLNNINTYLLPPQVFILVGAGIVGGIGLIIVEIIYHKHKLRRAKRTETAKIAFTRWKGTIEVRLLQGSVLIIGGLFTILMINSPRPSHLEHNKKQNKTLKVRS